MAQAHRHGAGGGLVDYLGGLVLAGGDHDGQPFAVLPWERRFVRGAFAVSGPAALSVARGNGKSALVAGIASAVVDPDGPLHGPRREAVAVASSFDQSRVIFEDVLSFLRAKHDLGDRKLWRVQDSANRATVEWRATGARVRCIGSDPAKAHGLRPALALLDEPAQWDATKQDRMVAAIRTGLGKVDCARDAAGGCGALVRQAAQGRGGVRAESRGPAGRSSVPALDMAPGQSEFRPLAEPCREDPRRGAIRPSGPGAARGVPGAAVESRDVGC